MQAGKINRNGCLAVDEEFFIVVVDLKVESSFLDRPLCISSLAIKLSQGDSTRVKS